MSTQLFSTTIFFRSIIHVVLCVCSLFLLVGCSTNTSSPRGSVVGGSVAAETTSYDERIEQQQEILRRQELEKSRQERELDDLRRQEHYNKRLREFSVQ